MSKKVIFLIRLGLFLISSLIFPVVYIAVKYKLYDESHKVSVNFWGFICICIIAIVFSVFIKYYVMGIKTRFSYIKQIAVGFIKVIIPLGLLLIGIILFNRYLDKIVASLGNIKQVLYIVLPCEFIAICVNPLPKWCFDNNVDGIGQILDRVLPASLGGTK